MPGNNKLKDRGRALTENGACMLSGCESNTCSSFPRCQANSVSSDSLASVATACSCCDAPNRRSFREVWGMAPKRRTPPSEEAACAGDLQSPHASRRRNRHRVA